MTDKSYSFLIDSGLVKGQAVRTDKVLNDIFKLHKYPDRVNGFLAEAITLGMILSAALKYDGVFTLQIQGDGAISSLIVSITGDNKVRAYAHFDEKKLEEREKKYQKKKTGLVPAFIGQGTLAFTVVQNTSNEQYQGVVSLEQATLTECVHQYFRQSEQIETAVRLSAQKKKEDSSEWVCGAVMIQRMPENPRLINALDEDDPEELWRTAVILLNSLTEEELQNIKLPIEKLLYRLYHSNNINVFMPKEFVFGCRCSREKVVEMLKGFPSAELDNMQKDGEINVDCQFCGKSYTVKMEDLTSGD